MAAAASLSTIVTPVTSSSSLSFIPSENSFTYFSPKPKPFHKTLTLKSQNFTPSPLPLLFRLHLCHSSSAFNDTEDSITDGSEENSIGVEQEQEQELQQIQERDELEEIIDTENKGVDSVDDCRLFVGNLPYSMTSDQLSEVFAEAGQVRFIEIIYDKVTDRSRGFGFVTMGSVDEAKEAIRMFDGSQVGGRTVRVNFPEVPRGGERAFNTLISAYSRCGSFKKSLAVYKMMLETGVMPDLSTYNAILAALARGGLWEESEKVLTEMRSGQCKPNELSYSCLLHAYANGKQTERMCTLAEEVYSGEITLHPVLLKTLVLVNSKTGLLVETERAFQELRRRGYSMDITTLNSLVSIYGRRQMVKKVNEILDFMKQSQFTPSLTTYNSLMYMYSRSGSFLRAEEILEEIASNGLQPDIISYNTVIYAYCKNGRLRDACRIFSEMRCSGIIPDVITYNIFIAYYAANDMFLEAIDMIRCMINHNCRPNSNTYNSVVDFFCKFNRPDEAAMFVNNLRKLDPYLQRDEELRLLDRIRGRYYK